MLEPEIEVESKKEVLKKGQIHLKQWSSSKTEKAPLVVKLEKGLV